MIATTGTVFSNVPGTGIDKSPLAENSRSSLFSYDIPESDIISNSLLLYTTRSRDLYEIVKSRNNGGSILLFNTGTHFWGRHEIVKL
jgi:hypothetical protein